ncbi:hypothetical protein ABK905_10220 [Acerihabitans sp. KWT182]|uniref:Uncharacterized protein n=1 Tax=Acerihabitans sp. KWT182 TaxID=3157919 RepID=A0AAU7QED8_9GAMM
MNLLFTHFRRQDNLNLLTASGITRMLSACVVLAVLWTVIHWASLLP